MLIIIESPFLRQRHYHFLTSLSLTSCDVDVIILHCCLLMSLDKVNAPKLVGKYIKSNNSVLEFDLFYHILYEEI